MPRIIPAFTQFFAFNQTTGVLEPLVDGWLSFLESGTTSTDKNTYADTSELIVNTNPVQLDAEGRCPSVFGTGSYRVVSYTNDTVLSTPAVQIQQFDPVPGGAVPGGDWATWDAVTTYSEGDIVKGSDGKYYVSTENDNTGNAVTSEDYWNHFDFVYTYNANTAYAVGNVMLYTDSLLYICLTATAAGETPVTDPTKWGLSVKDFGGRILSGAIVKDLSETEIDLGTLTGVSQELDLATGGVFKCTISTASQAFTLANVPTGEVKFEMRITNGGSQTVTFFSGSTLLLSGGSALSLTEAGLDRLEFSTNDGGTTIEVYTAGLDMKAVA